MANDLLRWVGLSEELGLRSNTKGDNRVSVGYGKANFSKASVMLTVVIAGPGKVIAKTAPNKSNRKLTPIQVFPVSTNPEVHGCMYTDSYGFSDGVILMLQASRKRNGISVADAVCFIRIHEDAAVIMVKVPLPDDRNSLLGADYTAFLGRGDVLTVSELLQAGFPLSERYIAAFMNPEEVAELYKVTTLVEGKPRPIKEQVRKSNGEVVEVMREEEGRRKLFVRNRKI